MYNLYFPCLLVGDKTLTSILSVSVISQVCSWLLAVCEGQKALDIIQDISVSLDLTLNYNLA